MQAASTHPAAIPGPAAGSVAPAARRKALVVTNIPTPYRVPLFRELARQLEAGGWTLKVAFGAEGYARRRWQVDLAGCGFEHETLGSRGVLLGENPAFNYPRLFALLAREQPAAIVVTGYSLATVKLWLRNLVTPTPYVIWSGTIRSDRERVSWWRQVQRRILVRGAAGFVAYGSMARDYLRSLGAPAERIHVAINTVETEFFRREAERLRAGAVPSEFLCIGDLTDRKRPDLAIRALAALGRPDAVLTLVGDGPNRAALEALAAGLGVAAQVRFEGFRQRAEIPGYLARARCLLFPTHFDIWGLVLPEAMAAGVPAIASVHAGATRDLVQDAVTGFAVDFEDTATVAARMARMLDEPEAARRMGEAARALIEERVNLRVAAAGIVAAIEAAAGGAPARGGAR